MTRTPLRALRLALAMDAPRLVRVTLVELDVDAPSSTVIGTIHTEADFGGRTLAGLFLAPRPTCPAM